MEPLYFKEETVNLNKTVRILTLDDYGDYSLWGAMENKSQVFLFSTKNTVILGRQWLYNYS
jgi:hypothetical protein